MSTPDLFSRHLEYMILDLLLEHQKMYGYEITQKVKELTSGKRIIHEGTLYPLLHKLESEGILNAEVEHIGNRMRKYYTLPPASKKKKKSMSEPWAFMQTMQILLSHKTA